MVRDAEFSDAKMIMELLYEGHRNSKLRDFRIDMNVARQTILSALQRSKVKGDGGMCVFVWDDYGVQGVIIGVMERIYHIAKEFRTTDIFFYISRSYKDPMAFRSLLKAFEDWSWSNSRVKKIDLGVTDLFGDPRRLSRIYERFGYNESGVMLEKYKPEGF